MHDTALQAWSMAGRTTIVTGASSGIGAEIGKTMAGAGARVVLVARDGERLASLREEIMADGGECETVRADLTASDAAERIVAAALDAFGRIDCLVNNAGIFKVGPFAEAAPGDLDAQYAINVRAPYVLTQAVMPHLTSGATVIFIGSNLAQYALAGTAAYSATKGAVEAMARVLAIELAPRGIRVNTVAPGTIRTPMTSHLDDPSLFEAEIGRTPARRIGAPADIAAAVLYLGSDASAFTVGSVLTIDGGASAC
jgi:NAD(P)-dependent dehydrogenase (short-subunit alcohol dehydrogenase family)